MLSLPRASSGAEERLELLSNVAKMLCIEDPSDISSCFSVITQLSEDSLSALRLLNQLQYIEFELQSHLALVRYEQRLVDKWDTTFEDQHKEEESSVMIGRRKEDLMRKAKEYHEELKTILVTVTRLKEQEKKNKTKEQELKAKRVKVKAFKGLPPVSCLSVTRLRF
ncbi:hypothetical protein H0H87_010642 [Tephrocybe sp. NHM501043]|nr:hypothetical protein H0H87_010642 [Tephrocybe sp. NHM501043]